MLQEATFEQVFGFVYTISNLCALVLILSFGTFVPVFARRFDLRAAIVVPNAVTAAIFLLAALLVFAKDMDGALLYTITLFSVFCCGIFAACLQSGIIGFSSRLPAKYVQAVISGQAISGAAVALVSLILLSTAPCDAGEPTLEEIQPQSFAYFFSSTLIVCMTLVAFYWLVQHSPVVLASVRGESRELLRVPVIISASASSNGVDDGNDGGGGGSSSVRHGTAVGKQMVLVKKMWRHCLGVCLTFLVTLSLFPGLTVKIAASHNLYDKTCQGIFSFGVWTSFLFFVFNVGDTLGRQLTLLKHIVRPERAWWLALGRLLFIPLMLGCNLRRGDLTYNEAAVMSNATRNGTAPTTGEVSDDGELAVSNLGFFSDDFWPVLFVGTMAMSNGYCASMEMMNGPKLFSSQEDQSFAGTVMSLFMTLGLFLGSLASFAVAA